MDCAYSFNRVYMYFIFTEIVAFDLCKIFNNLYFAHRRRKLFWSGVNLTPSPKKQCQTLTNICITNYVRAQSERARIFFSLNTCNFTTMIIHQTITHHREVLNENILKIPKWGSQPWKIGGGWRPGPPLECIRGPHARSHFLGKGRYFLAVVSERFPEKTRKRGCFCNCQW